MTTVAVVGQIGRDLVLSIDDLPPAGGSAMMRRRQELLGGKGANQAVACRQLGCQVHLLSVVGTDRAGDEILAQAAHDGIDVSGVLRRDAVPTALLVDVVGPRGTRRLLEDVAPGALLGPDDVRARRDLLQRADAVLVQLQQPGPATAAALEEAAAGGALTVADGAPADDELRRCVLEHAVVVRADATETKALAGWAPADAEDTARAARSLLDEGPRVVALATRTGEDVVAWPGGHVVIPHLGDDVVDPTGGGDAFIATLTTALLRGQTPETAGWWAAAASAQVVGTAGGRPDLKLPRLRAGALRARRAQEHREST